MHIYPEISPLKYSEPVSLPKSSLPLSASTAIPLSFVTPTPKSKSTFSSSLLFDSSESSDDENDERVVNLLTKQEEEEEEEEEVQVRTNVTSTRKEQDHSTSDLLALRCEMPTFRANTNRQSLSVSARTMSKHRLSMENQLLERLSLIDEARDDKLKVISSTQWSDRSRELRTFQEEQASGLSQLRRQLQFFREAKEKEERMRKRMEEEEHARKKAEEEERARKKKAEEEARKRKAEEEEKARKKREEEEEKTKREEEKARKKKLEEEEERARKKAGEEEKARKKVSEKISIHTWAADLVRQTSSMATSIEASAKAGIKYSILSKSMSIGAIKRHVKKEVNKVAANWEQTQKVSDTIVKLLKDAEQNGVVGGQSPSALEVYMFYLAEKLVSVKGKKFPAAVVGSHVCKHFPKFHDVLSGRCFWMSCYTVPVLEPNVPGFKKAGESLDVNYDNNPSLDRSSNEAVIIFYAFYLATEGRKEKVGNVTSGKGRLWSWTAMLLNKIVELGTPPKLAPSILDTILLTAGHELCNKAPRQFGKVLQLTLELVEKGTFSQSEKGMVQRLETTLTKAKEKGWKIDLNPEKADMKGAYMKNEANRAEGSGTSGAFGGGNSAFGGGNSAFGSTSNPFTSSSPFENTSGGWGSAAFQ
eukprot:g3451.t1